MPRSLPRKLRNQLIGLALVLLVLTAALNLILNYRYAHVPLRSAIIPRGISQAGQAADGLAFSPNGKTLAVADTQTGMSLWGVPGLRCRRRVTQAVGDGVSSVFWTPDSSTLLLADSMVIRRWDVRQDKFSELPTKQRQFRRIAEQKEFWNSFQFHAVSPSGKLAAGADAEGDVVAWNVETGHTLFALDALPFGKYGYPTNFCDIAFSPNDHLVALSSFGHNNMGQNAPLDIVIRDSQTGLIVRQWQRKDADLINLDDRSGGDLGDTGLTFSADGSVIAAADNVSVDVWDTKTGRLLRTLPVLDRQAESPKHLVFFHNGHALAGCGWGSCIPVWNVDAGKLLQTFYANEVTEAVAVSPDGKLLATGGQDAQLTVLAATGRQAAPDGRKLLNGEQYKTANGSIALWDISRLLR